ncbi:translocation/assembly module TamB domain-containing protein [Maribacter algicola]|nr:translocation/assembly module TamB domain-containing protein [Maribacter algicola]
MAGKFFLALMLLFFILVLLIRTPWVQHSIVTKLTNYISEKTGTKVAVEHVFITFSGAIMTEGIFLADKQGDTLLYSKELQMDLPIYPLLFKNELSIDDVYATGLIANIGRTKNPNGFSFSFLMEAFETSKDTTTTTKPMSISLGDFYLKDWKVRYDDAYLGTKLDVSLGNLETQIDVFNLEDMTFSVDGFSLVDSQITYHQTNDFPESNDSTTTPMPTIDLGNFDLKEVNVAYHSQPDGITSQMQLKDIGLSDVQIDLSKNSYKAEDILLKDSHMDLALNQPVDTVAIQKENTLFEWPQMEVSLNSVNLESNSFTFSRNGAVQNDTLFIPDAFAINDLQLIAENASYNPKNVHLGVENLSFKESTGINLKQLRFEIGLTDKKAFISNLNIQLNQSEARASLSAEYTSLDGAMENPADSNLEVALTELKLEPGDFVRRIPQLQKNTYLDSLAKHPITGSLKAKGSLKKVEDFDTELHWGPNTIVTMEGDFLNLTQPYAFSFNLNNIDLKSTKEDLEKFILSKNVPFKIPEKLSLNGTAQGTMDSFETHLALVLPEGKIDMDATADLGSQKQFKAQVSTDSLQLGTLLQNQNLRTISLQIEGSGAGSELSTMDAQIKGAISQFQFNAYNYKDLKLSGTLKNGSGNISLNVQDKNLNLTSDTSIDLTSEGNNIKFTSNIIGADLRELGFTKNDIKIAADINGSYSGSANNFNIQTSITNGIAVTGNEQYQISPIIINSHVEDSVTDATIESGFLNGKLYSNASPNRINKALKKQLENYFTEEAGNNNLDNVKAELKLALIPTPIISKVFFDGVQDLDSVHIDAHFDARSRQINGELFIPKFSYAGSIVDSLAIKVLGDSLNLNFSAGLSSFEYQPLHLKKTSLTGNLQNKELVLDFSSVNDTTQIMHINSELVFKKDTLTLHVSPKNLTLNKKQWQVPEDNKIIMAESYSDFQNLILSRNNQSLQISTKVPKMNSDHIGIVFKNFQLQSLLSLLNPDEPIAKGVVNGNFVILNPYEASGLVSEMDISEFLLMGNPLGTLSLNASSKSLNDYDFDLILKDGADLRLTGDYVAKQNDADLNLELDIQKFQTSIIQGFLKDQISNPSGYISGSMLVNGTLSNPAYSGRLNFNEVGLTLSDYKTNLNINEQQLDLNEEEITFNAFKVNDSGNGTITLDGTIITADLFNPEFDLAIQAEKFTVLDSKKGDNDLVYGKALIDTDLEVTGNIALPVINGRLSIGDATDLTYLVPQSQYEIQEREGVVIFVNRENPDAILTRNSGETTSSVFAGMDINTTLEISDEALFTIILDEKTQDKLQASGNATLNLNIDPNQDIRLSGRLELNSGFYRTSLYNLVSREFKINEGSSVVWTGDPYNAKLDVTAIYEIETSAAPLMSSISFGQDTGISGQYQRSSTFLVYLNVGGEITTPELSFVLDMPENVRGTYGGAVYGRIQQLNEQESELNKQVFSLLALNRFYPTSGSDGSSGGAVALARNNVNKVLSGELNSISNKLLGNSGFELDFDLDSFQENLGASYQNRTQLNINARKKLFNDRLIVTAGSAVDVEGSASNSDTATPLIGNVTLEYLLTEEGTYRLKGFRRQEYQNIIDGQLIVTGLAFIFDREFNKFSQLFNPVKNTAKKEDNPKKE